MHFLITYLRADMLEPVHAAAETLAAALARIFRVHSDLRNDHIKAETDAAIAWAKTATVGDTMLVGDQDVAIFAVSASNTVWTTEIVPTLNAHAYDVPSYKVTAEDVEDDEAEEEEEDEEEDEED